MTHLWPIQDRIDRATRLRPRQSEHTLLRLPDTHAGQDAVLASPARFVVLNCGRRWRKSSTAAIRLIRAAESVPGLYFWLWPSYPMGRTGWEMLRTATAGTDWEISEGRRRVRAPNGSEIWIKSADNPDSLRGFGLAGCVFDECRDMDARVWPEIIRAALADRLGWAMFASTPRGYDWFYTLYQAAAGSPGWAAFTFPTASNPTIAASELAEIEASIPVLVWRQEYLADFTAGAELGVFRGVRDVATLPVGDPAAHVGHQIVSGLDFAQASDFTVHSIGCATCRQQLAIDRFNKMEWALARGRIRADFERWGISHILAEHNSIGGPNIEALQAEGLPVIPFETTATSKPPLIQSYALAIEKAEWQLLADERQVWELEAYQMTPSKITGRPTYSAPSGGNDDIVIAGALMNQAAAGPGFGFGVV